MKPDDGRSWGMISRPLPFFPPASRWGLPALWLALALSLAALGLAAPAWGSPTEVVMAIFERSGGDSWQVSVTLRHADTGWKHYANLWVVETLEGKELGRRVLFHPHVEEQPFTRSQRITIPAGITRVRLRAGDNVDGLDGNTVVVDLTRTQGDRFQVR